MKGSRWFIVFIVAFLFIMFAIEYHLPKNFVWKPTFGHHDEQPFGCAVFDSVLSSSLPQGYTFSRKIARCAACGTREESPGSRGRDAG